MSFRKNLEYLRKTKKLSQEELAFKLGVSRQAVSKWESGAAYPETEKMLSICKIFDCSLDELMNDNVEEARKDKARKYSFNDLLNEVTSVLKRTIEMLSSMTAKSIFQFILEIGILVILILLLRIPFDHLYNLGNNMFYSFGGNTGVIISGLWNFIIELVYFVVAVATFIYIYKIRFLDKFDEGMVEDKREIRKDNAEVSEKIVKKVDIKKYDFGIFSIFGKIVLFFVKCFIGLMSLPMVFLLIYAVAGIVIGIVWMFSEIFYIGLIIFLLSFILFIIALLSVIYNFIVNHRSNWQRLFVIFIVSAVGFGIGSGIGILEFGKMSISTDVPSFVSREIKTEVFPMQEDLLMYNYFSTEYVADSSLGDSVKVEVAYYDMFTKSVDIYMVDSNEIGISESSDNIVSFSDLYNILLKDLKDKRLSNYEKLNDIEVKVYTSQENIDKIEENIQESFTYEEYNCINDTDIIENGIEEDI